MRCKIHQKFWNCRTNVQLFIFNSNPCLRAMITDDNGVEKYPHFVIMEGCCEDKEEIEGGYFWIDVEVDEKLFGDLIALKGQIKLGASYIKLIGGGMVSAAKTRLRDNINKVIDNAANDQ